MKFIIITKIAVDSIKMKQLVEDFFLGKQKRKKL